MQGTIQHLETGDDVQSSTLLLHPGTTITLIRNLGKPIEILVDNSINTELLCRDIQIDQILPPTGKQA